MTLILKNCEIEMTTATDYEHASFAIDEQGIGTLCIKNAGKLNILGTPVVASLLNALTDLKNNQNLRVLILRGDGDKAFIAGADIKEMATFDKDQAVAFIDLLRQLCEAVRLLPVPVIARIPGWCLGGGLELALACDLRICAASANLGMPEVKVGIPSIIHAALLPRLIGGARASWFLLTGEVVNGQQSLDMGLVDAAVALEDLDTHIEQVAMGLAQCGKQVLAQQKRLLREWQNEPLQTSIQNSVREFGDAFDTGEPQKYMGQFVKDKQNRKNA